MSFKSKKTETNKNSMLKRCLWRGQPVPCGHLFKPFPTDRGLCCVFNLESAETIFKDSYYKSELIKRNDAEESQWQTNQNSKTKDFIRGVGPGWQHGKWHVLILLTCMPY